MANIVIPFVAAALAQIPSAGFNNNFTEIAGKFNTYAVQTDVAKVITVGHTWNASQTFAGATFTADLLFTDALYDIGKNGATRPRDIFLSRNLNAAGTITANLGLTATNGGVTTGVLAITAPTDPSGSLRMSGSGTGYQWARLTSTGGDFMFGIESSVGGALVSTAPAYAAIVGTNNATALVFETANTQRANFGAAGNFNLLTHLLFTDATYDIGAAGATRPRSGYFSADITLGGHLHVGTGTIRQGVSSTSTGAAVTVYSPSGPFGYVFIYGDDGAGKRFFDVVLHTGFTAPQVLNSLTLAGAPAARVYTAPGSVLLLAMTAGYTVKTMPFEVN